MNNPPSNRSLNIMQILPNLGFGGVERGTVQIAAAIVNKGHKAFVVSGGGPLVNDIEHVGGKHLLLNVGKKTPATLLLVPKVARLLSKHKIDIIHSRSRLPAWLTVAALKLIPRNKRPAWFTTVHGPYSINFYSNIMNKGQQVIAVSDFMREYILQNYVFSKNKKITVIPRGVDEKEYYPSFVPTLNWKIAWEKEISLPTQATLLTLPGRVTRWKGQLEFIKLIAKVRATGIDAYGLIAGDVGDKKSDYLTELKHLTKSLNIDANIKFLGARRDLREILSISNCAYSLTNKPEAFGRTTIEALSLGTPVVGYDHGGTSEILKTVFPEGLVTPRDLDQAVALTLKFLATPGQNTPNPSHPYTVSQMQDKTIALYEKHAAN